MILMLDVKRIPLGSNLANCYLVHDGKEALIIDPGAEAEKIKRSISNLELEPIAILLTHCHFDHIGALDIIREEYNLSVYQSAEEKDWPSDPDKNLSSLMDQPFSVREADYFFNPDEKFKIANFEFKVLATPGHSPGGLSFVFDEDDFVLSGDALFAGSVGRTDLPGSETNKLLLSIKKQLFSLPGHYKVYSGHGFPTTIQEEIEYNPFFQ